MTFVTFIKMNQPLIVVLGPTAIGKTRLAVSLCKHLNGELVSADSRQVYKGMDIGTGKDLADFELDGLSVPYHLIDIKEAGEVYSVFEFQKDFLDAFKLISKKGKPTILCGGTGMYLSAALQKDKILPVPRNEALRRGIVNKSNDQLVDYLSALKPLHNSSDILDQDRLIRAIEIATFENEQPPEAMPNFPVLVIGLSASREKIKENIHLRLKNRINEGLIEEVEELIKKGVTHEQLNYYGLEYRYVSQYLTAKIDKDELFAELYKAICNYAKRQMTWYRRMEKKGTIIHWVDANDTLDSQIVNVMNIIKSKLNV